MVRHFSILIFVVLITLFACKSKKDGLPPASIGEIVRGIANTNVLMGPGIGIANIRPKQWDRYETLRSKATDKELLDLTNDPNGVVRCYAFQALAERKNTDLFPVVLRHLSDTASVYTQYGCLDGSQKVGDFFLATIGGKEFKGTFQAINAKQKATIDSLLLFERGNALEARDELLSEIEAAGMYYTRIRQIATVENNKTAVVALSKYRKQQDKPLIERMLNDPNNQTFGLAAVVNFPDHTFFPVLQRTLRNEVTKNMSGNDERLQLLYQAIVQYKDQPSRELLKFALKEAKDMQALYHYDYLHQALKRYPAAIYNGLLQPVSSYIRAKANGT